MLGHTRVLALASVLFVFSTGHSALAIKELKSGEKAPDFTLSDTKGVKHTLSKDLKEGKIVVLEWLNFGCPYVQKHYKANDKGVRNMPSLQAKYAGPKVAWYSVVSSAPGEEGYLDVSNAEAKKKTEELIRSHGNQATAVLLDPDGAVGTAYGAQHTPTMYVIDKKGVLAYQGAIDSNKGYEMKDLVGAENYLVAALDSVLAGQPVKTNYKSAYGCGVKYKH